MHITNLLSRHSLLSCALKRSPSPETTSPLLAEMASLESTLGMNGHEVALAWERWLDEIAAKARENGRVAQVLAGHEWDIGAL
ncbi:MAG: hypothetical protein HZA81_00820 [Candidatus Taylorbacteria bacterium]|nr:hypothetical protein [Candidatus Taylorbacteria bacterium]